MRDKDEPPFQPVSDPFLFPKALFGRWSEVKRSWMKVQRKAEAAGNWQQAIADCEMISVESDTTPIMMALRRMPGSVSPSLWHPYWIGELLCDRADSDRMPLINRLTLAGFDYCWFTLGVLAGNWYSVPVMRRTRQFYRKMLCRYVYWIPELKVIGQRCADCGRPPIDPYLWQKQMVILAGKGFDLWSNPHWKRLWGQFRVRSLPPDMLEAEERALMNEPGFESIDGVEVLVRGGIVTEKAGRFELIDNTEVKGVRAQGDCATIGDLQ